MNKYLSLILPLVLLSSCIDHNSNQSNSQTQNMQLSASTSFATQPELMLHIPSPEWQDQIIYFLMTDRFADGDSSNNDLGANEFDPTKESHFSGGDIQGVIDQLDYIKNMGATAVWTTPIVANQWWSDYTNYGGYHGYWATDFSAVDKHFGSLATYKRLSDQLHRRNMYLIQDIVVNHTGNFFNYKNGLNGYDAANTAKNFILLEPKNSLQPAPVQMPFDLIDRNNPEHVKANIYNWTPSITDYKNAAQQYTYQLATLADINTTNPVVIEKFKQIYGNWIKEVGVDAFRIDTVRYVEHDFFHRFMHDDNGIHAVAKDTGREHFLAFGEVFDTSKPYQNDAEHRVASYLGSKEKPELNSLISFPLHHELKTVFAQGFPTDQLAYRIEQHMTVYGNPYIIPTFIDNHDMGRFLASGDIAGFKQALATILTIPGIPTIYQGSAQAMTESRQAMFKGGYLADKDYFNQESELYKFIATLSKLRTSDKLFTRGSINIIASDKNGPGVLAYTRSYQGRTVLVMFNTSNHAILASNIKVSDKASVLTPLFGDSKPLQLNKRGQLTKELKSRGIYIFEVVAQSASEQSKPEKITIENQSPVQLITENLIISGTSSFYNEPIKLVKNTRLDRAVSITTDNLGNWQYTYPVVNLGQEHISLMAYHDKTNTTSQILEFTTHVAQPEYVFSAATHQHTAAQLLPPQHAQSIGQQNITAVKAELAGEVLKLTLTMQALTDDWLPSNGFDNVAMSIFFDLPNQKKQKGMRTLPLLNASMPNNWQWQLGHVVYGWGNSTFSTQGASATEQGKKYGIAPRVDVDKTKRTISLSYRATDFGINSWLNSKLYITTWDISGEGAYRELSPEPSKWHFGGGKHSDAKIFDAVEITLPCCS